MFSFSREHRALDTIQDMFQNITDIPYCAGTVPLNPQQSLLFYRSEGESRLIDFTNPTEAQLKALADACSPATFGRNKEDILDECYRKAGKLDSTDFSTQFSPLDSGIIDIAVNGLYKTFRKTTDVTVELYKLNVYGPGSFFKAHVDTPRSSKMFGSLVVVLPTPHTGGSLLFRHNGREYTFDSAKALTDASSDKPHVAFTAFFSDVEHEVVEVTSGYRVTLTYNLFYKASRPVDSVKLHEDDETERMLREKIASLLSAPSFLPDGGLLVFGLSYDYPFELSKPSDLGESLKGADTLLLRVCNALNLEPSIKAVYRAGYKDGRYCFMDNFIDFGSGEQIESLVQYLFQNSTNAVLGYDILSGAGAPRNVKEYYGLEDDVEALGLIWAKPLGDRNSFQDQYIAYGNEASIGCAYGRLCLVVRIKPANKRE